jgi:hypothetical protein
MMELLVCQGQWDKAVRYAYQDTVAHAVTDASGGVALTKAAPNTAPTKAWAAAWAAFLDGAFEADQNLLAQPAGKSTTRFLVGSVMPFVEALLARIGRLDAAQAAALGIAPPGVATAAHKAAADAAHVTLMAPLVLRKFCKRAAEAFILHDVYEALRVLLSRSAGSFGISALSAVEPDTVAIAAWGQQMSLALHEKASMALFGSEAAAMKVPVQQKGSSPAGWKFMTHRLDLDETYGEVMRLSVRPRPAVVASAAPEPELAPAEPRLSRGDSLKRNSESHEEASTAFRWNGLEVRAADAWHACLLRQCIRLLTQQNCTSRCAAELVPHAPQARAGRLRAAHAPRAAAGQPAGAAAAAAVRRRAERPRRRGHRGHPRGAGARARGVAARGQPVPHERHLLCAAAAGEDGAERGARDARHRPAGGGRGDEPLAGGAVRGGPHARAAQGVCAGRQRQQADAECVPLLALRCSSAHCCTHAP